MAIKLLINKTLIMIVLVVMGAQPVKSQAMTNLLGFTVTLVEAFYNQTSDTSTYVYHIYGYPGNDSPDYKDLSHWILGLCQDADDVIWPDPETDPKSGVWGVKFEKEISKTDTAGEFFEIKLAGNWPLGQVPIVIKANQTTETATIDGPACDPYSGCQLQYSVQAVDTIRILRPGVYAMKGFEISLSGTAGARLIFSSFTDLIYQNDPNQPVMRVSYCLADSLPPADSSCWIPAPFYIAELLIPAAEIEAGRVITLWERLEVSRLNSSCEYMNQGSLDLSAVCD